MKKLTVVLSLLSILFFSCKKEKNDTPQAYVVEGTYTGKIGSGSQLPSGAFTIKLKPNGMLDRISDNGAVTATGTWQLTGSAFVGHYESPSGVKVDLAATLTETLKRILGNWESTNGSSGTFYAVKE